MTITYPIDILSEFPGWTTSFDILPRMEYSRTAARRTIVKELGPGLWRLSAQSRVMRPNELEYWRARLLTLEHGLQTFIGFNKSRCYPIADPGGTKLTTGLAGLSLYLNFLTDESFIKSATVPQGIMAVGVDNKTLRIGGFPPGYVLSAGDYISYVVASGERFLRQVVAGGTADSVGVTPFIEVRPHLAYGTLAGQAVTVLKPWVPMMLVPGTVSTVSELNGRGRVSFEAMEAK